METIELLKTAAAKDALGFQKAFNEIIAPKVSDAIEIRKQEIAKTMFNKGAQA